MEGGWKEDINDGGLVEGEVGRAGRSGEATERLRGLQRKRNDAAVFVMFIRETTWLNNLRARWSALERTDEQSY